MPLGIGLKPPARFLQRQMLANAAHHVLQFTALRFMIENVINGDKRDGNSVGNVAQALESMRVVAAIKHARRKPDRSWRGLLQLKQKRAEPSGMDARRRHDNETEAFNKIQKIRQSDDAVSFFRSALAQGEQSCKPSPAPPVARISEDIRRSIGEDQSRADGQFDAVRGCDYFRRIGFGRFLPLSLLFLGKRPDLSESPHDAGNAVAVGNANAGET